MKKLIAFNTTSANSINHLYICLFQLILCLVYFFVLVTTLILFLALHSPHIIYANFYIKLHYCFTLVPDIITALFGNILPAILQLHQPMAVIFHFHLLDTIFFPLNLFHVFFFFQFLI